MNKHTQRKSFTRQHLIDAFWKLYCLKPISSITVKEIVTKAGYNRSTFYEYFLDVYDVLDSIEASLLPTVDKLPPMTLSQSDQPIPLDFFIKTYLENSQYYTVLLGDKGDPAFQSKIKESVKPFMRTMIRQDKSIDPLKIDYIMEFILSAMIGVMGYWFAQEMTISFGGLINLMYELFQHGLFDQIKQLQSEK
ncbi:MAG: TetR/AcrR family transcriptional regulator C-terminal domain-containing protein [Erysipelotrichaceae bacterium]